MAAFILHIDQLLHTHSTDEIINLLPEVDPNLIKEVVDLLESETIASDETYEPPLDIGKYIAPRSRGPAFYNANDKLFFAIDEYDSLFQGLGREMFGHMPEVAIPREKSKKILISFDSAGEGLWQIRFNDKNIAQPAIPETLPLLLQENLIIAYYQAEDYLIALHAGAVGKNGKGVVLPGGSGSGKSTLTAALAASGFSLFSDEIARLDRDGRLTPVPFAMNIKEGSWKVLAPWYPRLKERPEYLRFDGQRVKLLPPENPATGPMELSAILFPRYEPEAKCEMTELSPAEALRRITGAGYQLGRALDEKDFEALLTHLLAKPAYELTYGSLEDAVAKVEELLHG